MTTRTHLADALKRARKQSGLTMREAGAAVGRSLKTISAWETGQNEPSPEMLIRLCEVYGVDIPFFFPPSVSGVTYAVIDMDAPEVDELVGYYRASSPNGREQILEYAAMIAERHPKNTDDSAGVQTA